MKKINSSAIQLFALAGMMVAAVGCKKQAPATEAAAPPPAPTVKPFNPGTNVGVKMTPTNDMNKWRRWIASTAFTPRKDPFLLRDEEAAYEKRQEAERLLVNQGSWNFESEAPFLPPPPVEESDQPFEPQPYRRLSGIMVADSIVAVIEMENGQTYLVRPGSKIPNSEWTVASIDANRAVLRRGGNRLPREVTVRLETRPFARLGGGQPAQNNGAPGGGQPGAAPGGGRGGRGNIGGGE